jgi:cytochrome c553
LSVGVPYTLYSGFAYPPTGLRAANCWMNLMTRLPLLALVAMVSVLGLNTAHAASATKGDATRGKSLVYTCAGCHGVPGYENAYPNYRVPMIAGQKEGYILQALHEYRDGSRKHPTMHAQASSLTDQDIADIAAYLSSLAMPDPPGLHKKLTQAEQKALNEKLAQVKATTCASCHGPHGQAENAMTPAPPRLAGQYQNYLTQVLHEYQTGQRNNAIMKGMAASLTDADIEKIATYFSSQPSKLSSLKYHIQGASQMGASN